MKIGDLVTVETFGMGVIVEADINGYMEQLFKVAFFNGLADEWFYDGDLDRLEVINESR